MNLRVVSLRRYPVKAMGGEWLESARFDSRGMVGDRVWAVRDAEGRFAAGKNTRRMARYDGVFGFSAITRDDGGVTITGPRGALPEPGDPAADAVLTQALGAPVELAREGQVSHFDDGAVSLVGTASLEWCERELGVDADARRLRVNVVVETSEPFEEESWIGATLSIGGVVLQPAERIVRCRTVDVAQDGVATETPWLVALGSAREVRLGVYCTVAAPGVLSVGDEVSVGP